MGAEDQTTLPVDDLSGLRVALVHDFLLDIRGAERVFVELCRLWPEADVFTAVYDEKGTEGRFKDRRVHTSFLQRLAPSARSFRALLPLYPAAVESLDLSGYDLVVSSSSAWAHAVLCDERTIHVTYCHNPFRYAWNDRDRTLSRRRDPLTRGLLRSLFRRWRQWDWIAAQRPDRYVANSRTTQARIEAYFGRSSTVVHPPVETSRFSPGPVGTHYALVSALMPHKEIDIAVAAFNALGRPLIVVGDGPDYRRLRRLAGPTVQLAGRQPDTVVAQILQGARALIMTAVEEFGIVSVESQAAGRPVIARRGGGALETVVEGTTGCFWSGGPEDLARTVSEFDDGAVDSRACASNAARFDAGVFRRRILAEVRAAISQGPRANGGGRRSPSSRLRPAAAAGGP
ncbi:MAG TPA: glycosyltransferase [Solirubrobacteraceae bacterium]|nr:glycosyltransferase [Solirubrobacteraceae bacterium]